MNRWLMIAGLLSMLSVAGCDKNAPKSDVFAPVSIQKHDRCALCGMTILNYDGPKAEVYIKDIKEPILFCSGRDAFFFALQPENTRRLKAFFIHDIAKTDFDVPSDQFFMDAKKAHFVYDSRRDGVMGVEPVAFSDKKAAERFIEQWGGRLLTYPDITLATLDSAH